MQRKQLFIFVALLALAFCFRLAFGLSSDFWTDDEKQIYLIGLKFFSTGAWPYFGPDVTNTIQIPGALQGLVVGLPLHLWHAPEAPFVLLNVLSFASLCFFAWYCTKRLPEAPRWFVWTWLLTAPWTLEFSTHIVNPSYVLAGGILFFTGVIETYPQLSKNLIAPRVANLLMGLSLGWVMQFHMSWVILLPFVAASFYYGWRATGKNVVRSVMWFACGLALTGSVLVPTYLKYGLSAGAGKTDEVVSFNATNLLKHLNPVEGVLGRFLSFASFELPRFIGNNTATRVAFIERNWWLLPFVVVLGLIGLLQPVALIALWFKRQDARAAEWRAMKYLTVITLALLYVSFVFSFRAPHSHTFYVTLPIAMLYSLYCWSEFLKRERWRKFALVFVVCGVIFHAGLMLDNFRRKSLYINRSLPMSAIEAKDYRILGERREGAHY